MNGTEILPLNRVSGTSDRPVVDAASKQPVLAVSPSGADRQVTAASGQSLPLSGISDTGGVSMTQVVEAVSKISETLKELSRKLEFTVSEDTGDIVITVYDRDSEEVIRQIPGERAVAIAEYIEGQTNKTPVLGLLLDDET